MSGVDAAALGLTLAGTPLPVFAEPAREPMGASPLRRAGSVRRTSSIDATWPGGRDGVTVLDAHARDIATPADGGAPRLLAEDAAHVLADQRVIRSLASTPPRRALGQLIGARAGGHLRAALEAALGDERRAGTPLYLLLDDLAGATLVAGWAWSRWRDDWMPAADPAERAALATRMEGVCIGFRPGSAALDTSGTPHAQNATRVVPLPHPADPLGWHPLVDRGGVNFRRARRIDLWREDDVIRIDSAFQDSASAPDGGDRIAIHEYRLTATADATATTLLSVAATPGTLPYGECRAAPSNIAALVGTPIAGLRHTVLEMLRRTAGCTHLNDALRALAEVPVLAAALA